MKDHEKIEQEVIELIQEVIEMKNEDKVITGKDKIESLGVDSVKFMNMLIGLEDIIGKDIEDVIEQIDLSEIKVVDDVVDFVIRVKS